MSELFLPSVAALFSGSNESRETMVYEWRMIRRNGRPFLLVPVTGAGSVNLALYSAQRRRAKLFRALFPLLFHSPVARLFKRFTVGVDPSAKFIQFLARQAGVSPEKLRAPAVKFGGVEGHKSRLVLLLADETGRPFKVVKVGMDAVGREATRREADFLEQLPGSPLGCVRVVGRFDTPALTAFATDYFPGESPANDAGMEILFNAWLNADPPVPVANLDSWHRLQSVAKHDEPLAASVAVLTAALAGTKVRSTLYHGDFAPWNISAINSQNLQAFDWENGRRQGIPGWDWFHFIIQTAILAHRLPVERVVSEVEQLLASPRFKEYAATAGISEIVRPLVLGYLLHHLRVVNPLEGWRATGKLYELLSARWSLQPAGVRLFPAIAREAGPVWQLRSAVSLLANAFWEPTLNSEPESRPQKLPGRHGKIFLACTLMVVGAGILEAQTDKPRSSMPFFLVPCLLLTWFTKRRLGMLLAALAAVIGPGIKFSRVSGYDRWGITLWNTLMGFIILQMCVLLVDKIRRCKTKTGDRQSNFQPVKFSESWAVLLACVLWLGGVAWLDYVTPPPMGFLPLYLIPCMVITLMFNLRWGILAALVVVACQSTNQFLTDTAPGRDLAFHWNFCVRFGVVLFILLCLDKIRKGSIVFHTGQPQGRPSETGLVAASTTPLEPEVPPVLQVKH